MSSDSRSSSIDLDEVIKFGSKDANVVDFHNPDIRARVVPLKVVEPASNVIHEGSKVVDRQIAGPHAAIRRRLARRLKQPPQVHSDDLELEVAEDQPTYQGTRVSNQMRHEPSEYESVAPHRQSVQQLPSQRPHQQSVQPMYASEEQQVPTKPGINRQAVLPAAVKYLQLDQEGGRPRHKPKNGSDVYLNVNVNTEGMDDGHNIVLVEKQRLSMWKTCGILGLLSAAAATAALACYIFLHKRRQKKAAEEAMVLPGMGVVGTNTSLSHLADTQAESGSYYCSCAKCGHCIRRTPRTKNEKGICTRCGHHLPHSRYHAKPQPARDQSNTVVRRRLSVSNESLVSFRPRQYVRRPVWRVD